MAKSLDDLRAAIAAGIITHSRARSWCRQNLIYVYQRNPESPTGVTLYETFPESAELDSILRGGLSPLSPTERR